MTRMQYAQSLLLPGSPSRRNHIRTLQTRHSSPYVPYILSLQAPRPKDGVDHLARSRREDGQQAITQLQKQLAQPLNTVKQTRA